MIFGIQGSRIQVEGLGGVIKGIGLRGFDLGFRVCDGGNWNLRHKI